MTPATIEQVNYALEKGVTNLKLSKIKETESINKELNKIKEALSDPSSSEKMLSAAAKALDNTTSWMCYLWLQNFLAEECQLDNDVFLQIKKQEEEEAEKKKKDEDAKK